MKSGWINNFPPTWTVFAKPLLFTYSALTVIYCILARKYCRKAFKLTWIIARCPKITFTTPLNSS